MEVRKIAKTASFKMLEIALRQLWTSFLTNLLIFILFQRESFQIVNLFENYTFM